MKNIKSRKKVNEYSIKELREICQATAPNPAGESKVGLFSRQFSIYTTKLFLYTPLTPNHITVLSVLVFFSGILLLFKDNYWFDILAALIIFFSIVLDGSDGEVARFRQTKSIIGGLYAEPVSHDIQYGLGFFLFGFVLFYRENAVLYLILGSLAGIFKLLHRLAIIRYNKYTKINGEKTKKEKSGEKNKENGKFRLISELNSLLNFRYLISRLNKNFYSSTGVFLQFFIFALIKRLDLFLWSFCLGYFLLWVGTSVNHIYKFRKIYESSCGYKAK